MGVATPSETNPAPDIVSDGASLEELARAAEACQLCELYREATQVVFGIGPKSAPLMLIGEQPGDAEDQEGEPFVGPAGSVLAEALEEAGIRSDDVYLTNVVKHFRWKPNGEETSSSDARHETRASLSSLAGGGARVGRASRYWCVSEQSPHRHCWADRSESPKTAANLRPGATSRGGDDAPLGCTSCHRA